MSDLSVPQWPTAKRGRLPGGRLLGVDGSMWLYRRCPMGPMVDAVSPDAALASAAPLRQALEELASLGSGRAARRAVARSRYRAAPRSHLRFDFNPSTRNGFVHHIDLDGRRYDFFRCDSCALYRGRSCPHGPCDRFRAARWTI